MKYLLDTSTCIEIIKGDPNCELEFRKAVERDDRLYLSAVVEHELCFGVANSRPEHRAQNQEQLNDFLSFPFDRLPFDSEDALEAGRIRSYLAKSGQNIGAYDLLIAGQAVQNSCLLISDNEREFKHVPGLRLVNWKRR